MDAKFIAIFIVGIAVVLTAGCTAGPAPAGTATPTQSAPTPDVATAPSDSRSCATVEDCVPAQCCHPTSCTGTATAPHCGNVMCTMSCEGPIDCGAGSCGCVNGKCGIIAPGDQAPQETSVKIEASPQRYSPMMSSTPGIGLTPRFTGFVAADTNLEGNATDVAWNAINFEWNATFGRFLMWEAPDYKVHDIGNPVATDTRMIYWTFTDRPASTKDPVTITVTARDMTRQGAVLATSTLTLEWDGEYAVYVDGIR
jgi:hypothetical protein